MTSRMTHRQGVLAIVSFFTLWASVILVWFAYPLLSAMLVGPASAATVMTCRYFAEAWPTND